MTAIPRVLGRTGASVPAVWRPIGENAYGDTDWLAVLVGRDALDRRGDAIVRDRLASLGRTHCDLLIAEDIDGGDLKAGWPMHRLQRLRDAGLCRFFALRSRDALEAEWIATHTPVHATVIDYSAENMAARYRVFAAAEMAGTAVIAFAADAESLALQCATPQITASLCAEHFDAPPLTSDAADALWHRYQTDHPEPPKLKGAHPPED